MTEEEMAEKYFKGVCKDYNEEKERTGEYHYWVGFDIKNAYLAGLKAGKDMAEADIATIAYMQGAERYKTKWHKVADGDYPPCEKGNCTVNVLTDCGNIAYYNYDEECWVAEPSSAEIDSPVAWCELPKFKE